MELAVVILNWNAATDTIQCVQEMSAWQQVRPVFIVVDNASADNNADIIATECPDIHLIRNKINQGFAGGCNLGIEYALSLGDMPIMLFNNDASIAEKDVIRLLETLQNRQEIGIIGPALYDAQQKERLLSAGSKDPARHHHSHNQQLPGGSAPVSIVECVPGTIIIIQPKVFRAIGLLDETYFFASEIVDLCLGAKTHGLLSAIDMQARGYHSLSRSSRYRDTLYPYYIIRNRFLLIRKFHKKWKLFFLLFWTVYGLALSLKAGFSDQKPLARAVRQGTLDGLRSRFGNQNERIIALTMRTGGTSKRKTP